MKITVTIKAIAENQAECINTFGANFLAFRKWIEELTLNGGWGLPHENVTLRWLVETGKWEGDGVATPFVPLDFSSLEAGSTQREVGPVPSVSSPEEGDMKYDWVSGAVDNPMAVGSACVQIQQKGFEVYAIVSCRFKTSPLAPEPIDGICIVGRKVHDETADAIDTSAVEAPAGNTPPSGDADGNR